MIKIERYEFVGLLENKDLVEPILNAFDEHGALFQTENFIFYNDVDGDVSIIFKELDITPKVINWYKLTHIGRSLNLNGFNNFEDLEYFLEILKEDLKGE